MSESFNFRNPDPGEVGMMHNLVKQRALARQKYKALSQLLNGKTIDLRDTPALFEALNRERMEFDQILKLHPEQGKDCVEQAKEDSAAGRNNKSKACWAIKGHIPPAVYHSRPPEYWKDKKILNEFFKMYPKFAVVK